MSAKQGHGPSPPDYQVAIRKRSVVPLVLAVLVLGFELFWKGRVIAPGTLADRIVNLLLFLVIGPVMAWWGQTMARSLMQRLARSEAASEEKSRFLEQRNRQLQTVLQASRAMTAVLDLKQVAALVVDQVVTYTRFSKAGLVLGPDELDRFTMAASSGLPEEFADEFIGALSGPAKASSPVEWCRVTRQPVVVENLAKDFRTAGLRNIYAMAQVEGMIAIPLLYNDQFRGTLLVFQDKGSPLSTSEISLVSALTAQAALALENARLYTLTAQHRSRLNATLDFFRDVASTLARARSGVSPVLHLVAQVAARLLAPARVHLMITKSARQSPVSVTESVGMEPDAEEHRAATLPVALDADQFGQIDIYFPEKRALDAEEMLILQSFLNLTASALGSATLVAEMRQAVIEVESAYMGTLEALIKALEMRDHETEGHSRRVVQYSLSLAQKLGVPEEELVPIMRGALLHDIGKIGIPDSILRKQGPLNDEEWVVMRQHPRIGYEMLKGIDFLKEAVPIILHHHERWDGTGYPFGLMGEVIPLGARIFAVADAYDAMTSDRPYRKGRPHEAALKEIAAGSGRQFDSRVVEALHALPTEELARIRERNLDHVRA
ncbi:MAG TPA: HD domain-containing phosphohydrolase [Symbiobacteriaceae bacterium]|nr:HD domain-containing phosphohydrolase [Symbiobacteriaceae bacterium]